MTDYFDISYTDPKCTHQHCGCEMAVVGKHASTEGFVAKGSGKTIEDKLISCASQISAGFVTRDGVPRRRDGDSETEYIKLSMRKDCCMVPVNPPIKFKGIWPESREMYALDPRIVKAVQMADVWEMRERVQNSAFMDWSYVADRAWRQNSFSKVCKVRSSYIVNGVKVVKEKWVRSSEAQGYSDILETAEAEEIPRLESLVMKSWSTYHQVFGTTRGRPHVVAAMSMLFPKKYPDALLNMNRPTQKVPKVFESLSDKVGPAMDLLYHKMGIYEFQKEFSRVSLSFMKDMYLGASSGINQGPSFVIMDPETDNMIYVSPKGKKLEAMPADIDALIEWFRSGDEPPVLWNVTPKNENFFDWAKQLDDAAWEKWKSKVRLFVIPSSIFIHAERLVCRTRHLRERGNVIIVGHKHSRGGADKIAKLLGVTLENCRDPIIEEGDAKNFDQSVLEFFTNLYFSTMLIHEDPRSKDFELKTKIVEWLAKNMVNRLTRLFAESWVFIRGQVPSGCWNTSHMDSWIMAMYLCLYGLHTISEAPEDVQEILEDALYNIIKLVVYGDDHLWNKGTGVSAQYFNADSFARFCKKYFNVEIRDIVSGATFVSDIYDGYLVRKGATLLKHQFVLNPQYKEGNGQAVFLPFREWREFLIRAVWGRETKRRDVLDVCMSCIGHAYGTYASNLTAYRKLRYLFESLIIVMGMNGRSVVEQVVNRASYDDLKKFRQVGIDPEEILGGFPTMERLIKKNVVDWIYQDNIQHDIDVDFYGDGMI